MDPDQPSGPEIELPPPDDELKADLASVQWKLTARGVKLKPKEEIRKGSRSPGECDAVVMAWAEGAKAAPTSGGLVNCVNGGAPWQSVDRYILYVSFGNCQIMR
jgi:hypothetical protein